MIESIVTDLQDQQGNQKQDATQSQKKESLIRTPLKGNSQDSHSHEGEELLEAD